MSSYRERPAVEPGFSIVEWRICSYYRAVNYLFAVNSLSGRQQVTNPITQIKLEEASLF
jgi:hypothetical protein